MTLEDALFNWLQIQLVANARPEDGAARDTLAFFEEILREDHGLSSYAIERTDETMLHVRYEKDGRALLKLYPREVGEQLLHDINATPKYNEA
ncbi:hypothetical protein D3P07_01430 [Paenibacillus sp. 1011MAR3C5]|uniref:hypothetical protein n=1 Tax=Paenibacillus sp. 1011MAR3C5 TaxID=1675787 RepID=UPI000E6CDF0C|nr:hypothetical protein [Paenibacillus sp. 1011MAR3C5]RJE90791.1 hypothetical protein D3P07_01430 [Paenibacillus sp. 1011MAR3C5]